MSIFVDKLFEYIQQRRATGYKYGGYPVYNVTKDDVKLIEDSADYFGFRPEWLANLINFESGGTYNPAITNSIGATGLIQFMPATAPTLGTTTDALKNMTFAEQMVYVNKYIYSWYKTKHWLNADGSPIKGKMTQQDLFMTIFYPAAIGNPNYIFPDSVVAANAGIKTPTDYYNKATLYAPFKYLLDLGTKITDTVKKNPLLIIGFVLLSAALVVTIVYRKQIISSI